MERAAPVLTPEHRDAPQHTVDTRAQTNERATVHLLCGPSLPACGAVAQFLANSIMQQGRRARVVEISAVFDIGQALLAHPFDDLVFVTRRMAPDLIAALTQSAITVIFVAADSGAQFSHWLEHENEPLAAFRQTCQDIAPLLALCRMGTIARLPPETAQSSTAMTAFVRDHLGMQLRRAATGEPPASDAFAGRHAPLLQKHGLDSAIAAYDRMLADGRLRSFSLPPTLWQKDTGGRFDGTIDLTGSARGLLSGPHLCLPAGAWTVTLDLICKGISQQPQITLDTAAMQDGQLQVLAKSTCRLIENGRIKISYTFSHDNPNLILEFRMFLDQAVFEGAVQLATVTLTPSCTP